MPQSPSPSSNCLLTLRPQVATGSERPERQLDRLQHEANEGGSHEAPLRPMGAEVSLPPEEPHHGSSRSQLTMDTARHGGTQDSSAGGIGSRMASPAWASRRWLLGHIAATSICFCKTSTMARVTERSTTEDGAWRGAELGRGPCTYWTSIKSTLNHTVRAKSVNYWMPGHYLRVEKDQVIHCYDDRSSPRIPDNYLKTALYHSPGRCFTS